jgi:uncharacterized membrane protein
VASSPVAPIMESAGHAEVDAPTAVAPISWQALEERFAGRALALTGGLALVAAAIFFLSLAFSRGWITEPLRVLIGLVAGTGAFGLGWVLLARRSFLLGHVLTAVGLGVTSISFFAATRGYHLVPAELGLLGALVAAIAAAVLAVRTGSVVVAAYGLIAALIAPPLLGASPTLLTLGFVAVALVGTTGVALFRSWRWLPSLAFVLAAPQLASWLSGDADPTQAMIALAGFWAINIVAAAGEEVRIKRDDLRPSSATLVLANATFLLWGGFLVLAGDLAPWRGTFLGLAAGAHILVGAWFLSRQGLEHLFGNLVAGTGVACLTMAAAVQLGAPAVPLAWAAEAVALAWLAVHRMHRWSALAALVLGVLTVGHLLVLEYPLGFFALPPLRPFSTGFLHPEAASLGSVLTALVVTGWLVRVRWVRSLLAGIGVTLAAYALTFEVAGAALAAGLVLAGLAGLLLDRLILRYGTSERLASISGWVTFAWTGSLGSAGAGMLAIAALLAVEYPGARMGELHFATPFLHPETAALAVVLAGLVAAGVLLPARWARSALAATGLLLVAWALQFEYDRVALIATSVALLPVGVLLDRGLSRLSDDERFQRLAAVGGGIRWASLAGVIPWLTAAGYSADTFLSAGQLSSTGPAAVPFTDQAALVGALLAGSALAATRWLEVPIGRRLAALAALAVAAYVMPFEVRADLLAVLWVALAAVAFAAARWDPVGPRAFAVGAAGLVAGATVVSFALVATPDRLYVAGEGRPALLVAWPLAFAAVAMALYAASRLEPARRWRSWLEVGAGATAVYLASIAIVDVFQRMVGGSVANEELAKQGQVALSVLWTMVGMIALADGITRRHPLLRHAGFAMLGLATAKVFAFDLAAMDVAYRAVVFAVLGVLLLLSAALVGWFRGPHAGSPGGRSGLA